MSATESTSQKLFKVQDLISTFNISNRIEHLSKELTYCREDKLNKVEEDLKSRGVDL